MIVKASELKKLMKEAWESNILVISRRGTEEILIQGGFWVYVSDLDYVTNSIKAAVVEFGGEFPDPDSTFRCGKNASTQYEFEQTVHWDTVKRFIGLDSTESKVTPIIVETNAGNYMRIMEAGSEKYYIRNGIQSIISDKDLIETKDEPIADGPWTVEAEGQIRWTYWTNNLNTFAVLPIGSDPASWYIDFLANVNHYECRHL